MCEFTVFLTFNCLPVNHRFHGEVDGLHGNGGIRDLLPEPAVYFSIHVPGLHGGHQTHTQTLRGRY